MKITNNAGVSLTLAVWLLADEYDYVDKPNYISVTTLMKPLRQIILANRVPSEMQTLDVVDLISSSFGTSLHDSIEKAWLKSELRNTALRQLGYPQDVIERVRINPTQEELNQGEDIIPIYLEQRSYRTVTINGTTYTIGGKFDMVAEGMLQDNKSTSAYTWIGENKDEDYSLQGSLYRWLNPEKIIEEFIRINFLFTDWQKVRAKADPKYPQHRVQHKDIPLMSIEDTRQWILWKLSMIQKYSLSPEKEIPECTDKELWRSDPQFKYYSDPAKTSGRSTKNFDSLHEANQHKAEKGKGIVITVPGSPKRCGYCNAYPVCSQRLKYE